MIRDIVFSEEAKEFLANELKRDKNSGTYLVYGSDMGLLFEYALSFAKGLCCTDLENDFCDKCSVCKRVDNLSYSDLEIFENPNGLTVDEIRTLGYKSSNTSYEGTKKVFIIKDISKMKKEAANALLKVIEEPNENTYFILLNKNLNILPTIKSRAMLIKIKKRTASQLGVDNFTHEFFRGSNQDICEFKKGDFNLEEGYSYLDIRDAIKRYSETNDIAAKIDVFKGIRDFVKNRNYIPEIDKIYFAEEIVKGTSDRNIFNEIVAYTTDLLGDIEGLEKRLEQKNMLRAPINMKLFFINFFINI